ncbi:MAG: DUF3179 domain-containing protein [Proteobacteria bacterium]|nr:DUF3179 domain-containing protein [Pseudomonadota bacterium]
MATIGRLFGARLVVAGLAGFLAAAADEAPPEDLLQDFPKTDFSRRAVPLAEFATQGPRRDTIPAVDAPAFAPAGEAGEIGPYEPIVSVTLGGETRGYPLRVLLWHELVNDTLGDVPILVSYCPLCNSAIVYDRRVGGRVLDFANSGRVRHYNMVMYDRATESLWQQFIGEAIVGELSGTRLKVVPARIESFERFQERAPEGKLLVPAEPDARPYGASPFAGIDEIGSRISFPYPLPEGMNPMARVVVVGGEAWELELVQRKERLAAGDLIFTWDPGQNSIHDNPVISLGRDVGNVEVMRQRGETMEDVRYEVTFAFAFRAFHPDGPIHRE